MSSFKVSARTILQLGAELISSDEIAFYELVKNAIDAESPYVKIHIISRIKHPDYLELKELIELKKLEAKKDISQTLESLKTSIEERLVIDSPQIIDYLTKINNSNSIEDLEEVLKDANSISIQDLGQGMSLIDLEKIYLTIGTRNRYLEKHSQNKDSKKKFPILGEKGIGRLSVMRLGNKLLVETTQSKEINWNILRIDWNWFSHNVDKLLSEIEVAPKVGLPKKNPDDSGTTILISDLNSDWNMDRVKNMANESFNRFADPFEPKNNYPINLYFNESFVEVPGFDPVVFKYAHATVTADFEVKNHSEAIKERFQLNGKVNYRLRNKQKSFSLNIDDLNGVIKPHSLQTLSALGSFSMKAYWFNRPLLTEKLGVSNAVYIKKIVKEWAGGLMLYRDNFRVFPYGEEEDDWLDLDKKAFASQGYKVNRQQIIGKVNISSLENPKLIDQTNREGLRDGEEKQVFIKLLKHILEQQMRVFLVNIDEQLRLENILDLDTIQQRFQNEVQIAFGKVKSVIKRVPEGEISNKEINDLSKSFDEIEQVMQDMRNLSEDYKTKTEHSVHLAGNGLLAEMLAHELNRSASNVLQILPSTYKNVQLSNEVKSLLRTLESEMISLKKRLEILEPVSSASRQSKSTFDLVELVKEIFAGHKSQFDRHGIKFKILVVPASINQWKIKLVKGMIVQVIENLISNSVYWLKSEKEVRETQIKLSDSKNTLEVSDNSFTPQIDVVLDIDEREIKFTDNGPGVSPDLKDEIFLPFTTFKPPGEGKGLGLYISRENAIYHDAEIFLSEARTVHSNRLNTFILKFTEKNHGKKNSSETRK